MKTTDRQIKCRAMFEALGYPISGACAMVGNFCRESGEDLPTAFRKAHLDHGSQGLAQWRLGRLDSLEAFITARHPRDAVSWLGNMAEQVDFVDHELRTDYPLLREKLMRGGDVAALTADFCWQFERPSKALSGIAERIEYAKALAAVEPKAGNSLKVPTMTVVDHLQDAAAAHANAQTGGTVLAAGGILAGTGVVAAQVLGTVPTWELIGGAVAVAAVVVGLIAAVVSGHKAANVRTAISGVTPDAPPADLVEHSPVELAQVVAQPVQQVPMTEDEVARIVQRLMAANRPMTLSPDAEPGLIVRPVPLSSTTGSGMGGATMTVGHAAQPIEGAK